MLVISRLLRNSVPLDIPDPTPFNMQIMEILALNFLVTQSHSSHQSWV